MGLASDAAHELAERDVDGPGRTAHMFTDVWVPAALADLLELTAGWAPDLVVTEEQEYAGVLLAAVREVPCVTHSWASPARPAATRAFETARLAPLWEQELPGIAPGVSGSCTSMPARPRSRRRTRRTSRVRHRS